MDSVGGGTEVESIIFHLVSAARVGVGVGVGSFSFWFGLGRRAVLSRSKQRREFEI